MMKISRDIWRWNIWYLQTLRCFWTTLGGLYLGIIPGSACWTIYGVCHGSRLTMCKTKIVTTILYHFSPYLEMLLHAGAQARCLPYTQPTWIQSLAPSMVQWILPRVIHENRARRKPRLCEMRSKHRNKSKKKHSCLIKDNFQTSFIANSTILSSLSKLLSFFWKL